MANEISVNIALTVANGNLREFITSGSQQFTQAAVGGPVPGYQTIGTTEETITTSELSTLGWAYFQNLDATNYVELGFSTGVYGIRLEPGEPAVFRLKPAATIYAKANTSACKLQVKIFED
jgi:hypothetical protein